MHLTEWERNFLEYFMNKFNAKWMRVFNNKHPLLDTRIDLYSIYKRKLKHQAIAGQMSYSGMFKELNEGDWYLIADLLNTDKEEI